MAGKYQRKSKSSAKTKESPVGDENSLFRESAEQIARHEELTGINRAMWDTLLNEKVRKSEKLRQAIKDSYS